MRNSNYYQSVVKQHFSDQIDKYRDAIMGSFQTGQDQDDPATQSQFNCFCNYCGDDITQLAQSLAKTQFDEYVLDHQKQVQSNKQNENADQAENGDSQNG